MSPHHLHDAAFSYETILSDLTNVGIPIARSRMTLQLCTHMVYDWTMIEVPAVALVKISLFW